MDLTDELFLLLTTDAGKTEGSAPRGFGLAATCIAQLIRAERVSLSDDKDPRVRVLDPSPTDDAALDHVLAFLARKDGKKLSSLVAESKIDPSEPVSQRLIGAGVLGHVEKRALGLVPERFPVLDAAPEQAVRARLADVLAGLKEPSDDDRTLLAVLQAMDVLKRVLKTEVEPLGRDLKRRVKEITEGNRSGDAVGRAVDALNAALVAAIIVPTAAMTSY